MPRCIGLGRNYLYLPWFTFLMIIEAISFVTFIIT